MDDSAAALLALDEIKAFAAGRLREALPYLKTEALDDLLEKSKALCREAIEQQVPIIAATKKHISFTSLSAELRNRIYDLAIEPRDHDLSLYAKIDSDASCFYSLRTPPPPAITQVSRQLRAESLPMFYCVTKITLKVHGAVTAKDNVGLLRMLHEWLGVIGPRAAGMIKNFEVTLEPSRSKSGDQRQRRYYSRFRPNPTSSTGPLSTSPFTTTPFFTSLFSANTSSTNPNPTILTSANPALLQQHSAMCAQYRARNSLSSGPTNAANRGRYLQELGVLGYGVKDSACKVRWDVEYELDEKRSLAHCIDLTDEFEFV